MVTTTQTRGITREALMKICDGDIATVRALEALFASVRVTLPDAIDNTTVDVSSLTNRSYLVVTHAPLATPNDRTLAFTTNLSAVDGGAGNSLTLSVGGTLIAIRRFTANGTYTPTTGTKSVLVYAQGAGGQGGGSPAASVTQVANSAGGNSGAQTIGLFASGFAGAALTVGLGGATGGAGAAGQDGGDTTFGALMTAGGGKGGPADTATTANHFSDPSGTAATATGGTVANLTGNQGNAGFSIGIGVGRSGRGGVSQWGTPGSGKSASGAGGAASGFGAGGGGALSLAGGSAAAGGAGAPGFILVYEYS